LAVDEERRGEVLEPRAGRRRGVAGEVRAEVTVADQPQCSRRARDVRPFGLPRLHGGFLSARTASALGVVLLEPARRRIEPRGQLVLEELDLVADREEVTGGGARRRRRAAPPS